MQIIYFAFLFNLTFSFLNFNFLKDKKCDNKFIKIWEREKYFDQIGWGFWYLLYILSFSVNDGSTLNKIIIKKKFIVYKFWKMQYTLGASFRLDFKIFFSSVNYVFSYFEYRGEHKLLK